MAIISARKRKRRRGQIFIRILKQ